MPQCRLRAHSWAATKSSALHAMTICSARVAADQGADYVAFGSFFASSVKPGAIRAPLAVLPAARVFGLPVVAIGGITLDNAGQLIAAGADAIAVISAVFAAPDPALATHNFCQLFQAPKT